MKLLYVLLMLALPVLARAQFTYITNANNTITITGYTNSNANVTIPGTLSGLPVTSIGDYAFQGDAVSSVSIPDSVTNIGQYTFAGCGLSGITLPNSIINIGVAAFSGCPLTSIIIPTNITSIEDSTFNDCYSLTNIIFPAIVTNIGDEAFFMCSGLTSVVIPGNVTTIGADAFFSCQNLTNVIIPASVSVIGSGAFSTCAFNNVTVPGSVTDVGGGAFSYCNYLTNVTFLGSVSTIEDGAFYASASLKQVHFMRNAPDVPDSYVFFGAPVTVYYLPGTTGWAGFATTAAVPIALWYLPNPLILNFEPTFGIQTKAFGFTISWATNASVVVDACTNLANPAWKPLQTNALLSGSAYFSDPQWANYHARFYRPRPQ